METPFNRFKLDNRTTVLTEHLPYARTVSVGVWLKYGSRLETAGQHGAAHFIEHMLFKGTPGMDPRALALAFESVGGSFNASASKEITNIYAKMLSDHLPLAVRLLSDMATRSTFPDVEFDREKKVVLEEIKAHLDEPDEVAYDHFLKNVYGDDPIGHPILGTADSVGAITRDKLYEQYRHFYRPAHLVVAVAGNVADYDVPALVLDALGADDEPACEALNPEPARPDLSFRVEIVPSDTHQVHFYAGMPGVAYSDEDRYVYAILDVMLSGGMSSRLFQEVRERRGLVYDVTTEHSAYSDNGVFCVYAATGESNLHEVLRVIVAELIKVRSGDIKQEELDRVKEQLRAYVAMSFENVSSRMMKLARCELFYGRYLSDDEILEMISRVTLDDLARVSNEFLRHEGLVFTALGPFDENKVEKIESNVMDILGKL